MAQRTIKLTRSGDVYIPEKTVRRLIDSRDGSAALVYLYLAAHDGMLDDRAAMQALGMNDEQLAHALGVLSRLGLTETPEQMLESAKAVAALRPHAVKLHMLYLEEGTAMTEEYRREPFPILSLAEYVSVTVSQLELFHPDTVIGRLTGDGQADRLVAPLWSRKKFCVLNEIDKEFRRRGTMQGSRYTEG